jgi:hypothetical protein
VLCHSGYLTGGTIAIARCQSKRREARRTMRPVPEFDPSRLVERRLRQPSAALCIHAFGVDAPDELQYSSFER